MELKKYQSPFPERPIAGKDFNELADYVNHTLEEIVVTNRKLQDASDRLAELDKTTLLNLQEFREELSNAKNLLTNYKLDVSSVAGKIEESSARLRDLDQTILSSLNVFGKDLLLANNSLADIEKRQRKLTSKLRNFYSRQIELFGVFIAIFSFIIAGIQISIKLDGSFQEILLKSTAVFLPVVAAIVVLMVAIRLAFR